MKKYTGIEAIKRLQTHPIQRVNEQYNGRWFIEDGKIHYENDRFKQVAGIRVNDFFENIFIDYVEHRHLRLEKGEMFVGEHMCTGDKWYLIYENETDESYVVSFGVTIHDGVVLDLEGTVSKKVSTHRKATDEELEEFERFMIFYRKGRNMNEFIIGDRGEYQGKAYVVTDIQHDVLEITLINSDKLKMISAIEFEPHFFIKDMVG